MLDCVVRNEKQPDVVQISGGEPTLHPDFFRVLDMCKDRPIRHLMVNTNGIRIAQDEDFAKRLADFMPQFEVYLQFDSLRREPLMQLRGADLRSIREKALERLNKFGISTTLVVTVERGVNDGELGSHHRLCPPAARSARCNHPARPTGWPRAGFPVFANTASLSLKCGAAFSNKLVCFARKT